MNDMQKIGLFIADKVNRIGQLIDLTNAASGSGSGSIAQTYTFQIPVAVDSSSIEHEFTSSQLAAASAMLFNSGNDPDYIVPTITDIQIVEGNNADSYAIVTVDITGLNGRTDYFHYSVAYRVDGHSYTFAMYNTYMMVSNGTASLVQLI